MKVAPAGPSDETAAAQPARALVLLLGLALFIILVVGWSYHAATPSNDVGLTLSFLSGMTMIFLPCTFPLVLALVPLAAGLRYSMGLVAAVIFGLGTSITMAGYTVAIASVGKVLHLDVFSRTLWFIGGSLAFLFGLSELALLRIPMPSFAVRVPAFIHTRGTHLRAFLLGLFLGNLGVDCPCPAFYVILVDTARQGDLVYGATMGFVHGLGRVVPLLLFAIFAMAGANVVRGVARGRGTAKSVMAWSMVGVGAWMIAMHAIGHDWYEESPIHIVWNNIFLGQGENVAEVPHPPGDHNPAAYWYAPWLFLVLIAGPVIAYRLKRRRDKGEPRQGGRLAGASSGPRAASRSVRVPNVAAPFLSSSQTRKPGRGSPPAGSGSPLHRDRRSDRPE